MLNTSMTVAATSPVDSVWTRKTTRLCHLPLCRPGVVLSCKLVVASPLVVLSLRRPLVVLMRQLVVASPLAVLSLPILSSSCCASWLSHCLSSSSRCANLLSTRRASLLSHCLSSSSRCTPHRRLWNCLPAAATESLHPRYYSLVGNSSSKPPGGVRGRSTTEA